MMIERRQPAAERAKRICHTRESKFGQNKEVEVLRVRFTQYSIGAVEIVVDIADLRRKL